MRIDDAGPRTWLLAAAAGWSLCLWVLALAGMGGRIAVLPDDPSLLQPLPAPAPAAAGRLGPPGQYAAISTRPVLSPDRTPQPFSLRSEAAGEVVEERFEYVLTGVLLTPGLQMAILQPAGGGESVRLRVGQAPDDAPSWRLVSLSPRAAVFEGPGGEQALELRSYDGGADVRSAMPAGTVDATPRPAPPMPPDPMREAADPGAVVEEADAAATPQEQMDAIRKRIEARREQLRREARSAQPPQQR